MTTLGRGARASVENLSIQNDPGANSRSKRGIENLVIALRRSPERFRETCSVGVIVDLVGRP